MTCTKGLSMRELEEIKEAGLDEGMVSWNILERCLLRKSGKSRRMWIQGSRDFVLNAINIAKLYNFATFTSVVVERRKAKDSLPEIAGVKWKVLNHGRLGGLTKGNFSVCSSADYDVEELYRVADVRPRLGCILRGGEHGRAVDNLDMKEMRKKGRVLDEKSLVRFGEEDVKVFAPNFFTKSLCYRALSTEELMDVYDVDVGVQKKLLRGTVTPSKMFINQVPGKVLYRLGVTVLRGLGKEKDNRDDKRDKKKESKLAGKRKVEVEEVNDELVESLGDEERGDSSGLNKNIADPNLKAAKNDDAKANAAEWNKRAAKSIGEEYVPSKHDKALELMRRGCLRWYQGKVRRSFLRYIRMTYGDNWEEIAYGKRARVSGTKRKRRDDGDDEEESNSQNSTDEEKSEIKGLKSSDFDRMRAELIKDLKVGKDAIRRAGGSSWWEWDAGSTLYFWRWPEEYKRDVRDGLEVCVEGQLPEYWARQQWPEDPKEREQLKAKLHKPVIKKYMARGFVRSLTGFFSVPKGEGDIRIVYDATKSLLNEAIWAPNFFLPLVDTVLRNATHDTYYGDIDLGEMFLNYFLDEKLRPYAGVDITGIKERIKDELGRCISFEEKKRVLYRWEQNLMGLRSSPYNSIRTFSWSEDFIRGDRTDIDNPLRWDWVKLNLPGDEKYNPSELWVYKYDALNDKVAAFFETFVDDIRSGDSGGEDACQRTTHVIASRINYLGQQDSPRKRRKVSMTPGAWSGAMIWSNKEEGLFVTCAQEKWDKAKRIISELVEKVGEEKGRVSLNRKQLERDRGFLIHIARTFTQMIPYLKGIHHTLESWRFGRDADGWKKGPSDIIRWLNEEVDFEFGEDEGSVTKKNWREALKSYREAFEGEAPEMVEPVERLIGDLKALSEILKSEKPISRLVRGTKIKKIRIMFGDASGAGFGATWETRGGGIRFRYGLWEEEMQLSSSNLRELQNLVESLEVMAKEGDLDGVEIFVFTDNSTAERAFFKGTSKSKALHLLVLRLKLLEVSARCKIHLIHVAGKRMIQQGSDGLSRGNLTEGVMGGWSMGSFVPLHLGALERAPGLEGWIRSWGDGAGEGSKAEVLTPEGWFERGHDMDGGTVNCDGMWMPKYKSGTFIWAPPPAAAEAALEQLRKARHKRQTSAHIFVCPRLMTPYWAKHLNRSADFITIIPAGQTFWPEEMHEPLILACYFPFLKHRPWQLKGQEALLGMEGEMRRMWKEDPGSGGSLLRKLWRNERALSSLPKELVWKVLQSERGLQVSNCKAGKRRRIKMGEKEVNLDILWCRETSTVYNNYLVARKKSIRAKELGLDPICWRRGPWIVGDNQGFQVALEMVRQSQNEGKNDTTYQQFDSIRKFRTADFNEFESSVEAMEYFVLFGDGGRIFRTCNAPTQSRLFRMFMKGCEKRMGRLVRQNKALSLDILKELLHAYELELLSSKTDSKRKRFVVIFTGYLMVSYVAALRGGEGFMMETKTLCKYIEEGRNYVDCPYVLISLMGRFKSETGERNVLLALAGETKSGLKVRKVVERLVGLLKSEGKDRIDELSPAICHEGGKCYSRSEINKEFVAGLTKIQKGSKNLIEKDLDIELWYNIHRSLRRGATSRATAVGLTEVDISMNNRWRLFELARGARPKLRMHELYTDIKLAIDSHLRFSQSL